MDVCINPVNGRPKRRFETKHAAEKAAKKSRAKLFIYACKSCNGWHHSSQPPRWGKIDAIPSAAKLRRQLAEAGRQIRATEKWLAKVEAKKAAADDRAARQQKQSELEYELERQAISEMTSRLIRV